MVLISVHCDNAKSCQISTGVYYMLTCDRRAASEPVLFDSGVRSGSDVATALALQATAVGIGRTYLYALAIGGVGGLVSQLRSVLAELDLLMAVDGFPSIADLRAAGAQRI